MGGLLRQIIAEQRKKADADPAHAIWYNFWFIIRRIDRVVVGSADFKSPPDTAGEVEIGYGLGKAFEHNGYMTETVRAMCDWALQQTGVKHIIAETDLDGLASQRILQRCPVFAVPRKALRFYLCAQAHYVFSQQWPDAVMIGTMVQDKRPVPH